jgi:hypothetical protein
LRDVIVASITDDHGKRKLIEATENQTAKRIYEAVNNRIDPIREQLPVELQESVGAELEGFSRWSEEPATTPSIRQEGLLKRRGLRASPAFSSLCQKLLCADGLAEGEQDIELLANWLSSSGEES